MRRECGIGSLLVKLKWVSPTHHLARSLRSNEVIPNEGNSMIPILRMELEVVAQVLDHMTFCERPPLLGA